MIYYIYKVRRKQTFIHFSRSALPHRYLRYISWISWNGSHRPPPAGFFHPVPQPAHASFSRRCLYPKAAIAAPLSLPPPRGQSKRPPIFPPRKRKNFFFPFFRAPLRAAPSVLLCPQALRTCCGRSIARCPRRLLRPSHKQKKCGPTALRREPAKV